MSPTPVEGRNISGSAQGPLTIASAPFELVATADLRFNELEQDLLFGILICRFMLQNGVWGTHNEAWVY